MRLVRSNFRLALTFALLFGTPCTVFAQSLSSDRLFERLPFKNPVPRAATAEVQVPASTQISHSTDWVQRVAHTRMRSAMLNKRSFWFNLSQGKRIRALRRGYRSADSSGFSITGRLRTAGRQDGPLGFFIISKTSSGGISGHFRTSDGSTYNLIGTTAAIRVEQIDSAKLPPCGSETSPQKLDLNANIVPIAVEKSWSEKPKIAAVESETEIRVLVVYPPSLREALGSGAAVDARISTMINYANTSYNNSGVPIKLVKAFSAELSQEGSENFNSALDEVIDTNDEVWDEVHALRTLYSADLVSVIMSASGGCGVAKLNDSSFDTAEDFAPFAFSVVYQNCISSFAHELGHNMGLQHNIEDSGPSGTPVPGKFSYSYGWRWQGTSAGNPWYRDVMSRQGENNEEQVPYFSNPNVLYDGTATGTSTADNARTLAEIRDTVAAYVTTTPAATPSNTPTVPPGSTATPTVTPTVTPTGTVTVLPTAVPTISGPSNPPSGNGGTPVATPTPDGSSGFRIIRFAKNCQKNSVKITVGTADGQLLGNAAVQLIVNKNKTLNGTTSAKGVATIKNSKIGKAKLLQPKYEGQTWGYKGSCKK